MRCLNLFLCIVIICNVCGCNVNTAPDSFTVGKILIQVESNEDTSSLPDSQICSNVKIANDIRFKTYYQVDYPDTDRVGWGSDLTLDSFKALVRTKDGDPIWSNQGKLTTPIDSVHTSPLVSSCAFKEPSKSCLPSNFVTLPPIQFTDSIPEEKKTEATFTLNVVVSSFKAYGVRYNCSSFCDGGNEFRDPSNSLDVELPKVEVSLPCGKNYRIVFANSALTP